MDDLDLMLSRLLDEPADAGFTARVLAGIGRMRSRDDRIEIAAWVAAACCVLATLPMTEVGRSVALSASHLATSVPFAFAVGLLFLSRLLLDAVPG